VTPVLHILIGALALAFGLLILRADPRRWDNRAFAALGVLDAATALFRGIASLFGASMLDPEVVIPCSLLAPRSWPGRRSSSRTRSRSRGRCRGGGGCR
jgi:hypothetical protein